MRKESGLTFTYQTRATTTTLKQPNTTLTPLTFDGGEGKNELQFIYSSRKVNASISEVSAKSASNTKLKNKLANEILSIKARRR